MTLGKLETEAVNATRETEEGLEYDFLEDEPEGLIGRLQTYWQDNLNDIVLLIILISLTVINFFPMASLLSFKNIFTFSLNDDLILSNV